MIDSKDIVQKLQSPIMNGVYEIINKVSKTNSNLFNNGIPETFRPDQESGEARALKHCNGEVANYKPFPIILTGLKNIDKKLSYYSITLPRLSSTSLLEAGTYAQPRDKRSLEQIALDHYTGQTHDRTGAIQLVSDYYSPGYVNDVDDQGAAALEENNIPVEWVSDVYPPERYIDQAISEMTAQDITPFAIFTPPLLSLSADVIAELKSSNVQTFQYDFNLEGEKLEPFVREI